MINFLTLTANVLELKVNLKKYIFYMLYFVYSKLLAARLFADTVANICCHLLNFLLVFVFLYGVVFSTGRVAITLHIDPTSLNLHDERVFCFYVGI